MKLWTDTYLNQLKELHARKDRPRGFGGKIKPLGLFNSFMDQWKPKSALDYGCGKGTILQHLQMSYKNTIWEGYDPAVKKYSKLNNKTYDVVFSNDVLEHIEPDYVDLVLKHIDSLTNKYIWLRIDTEPARKILKDGRNAHISLNDANWWSKQVYHNINARVLYMNLTKGKLDIALTKDIL